VKKLGDEVSRELGRFGAAEGMTRIVEAWPGAVGPTIARNAWPARIARDGTMHVSTSSSSWAFELGQLEADVLRRLRAAVGAKSPKKLRFAVGKLPELGRDDVERARSEVAQPRPEDVERAAELAASIDDDELREAVAKAAAQSLFRAGNDRSF
jgi:predicted nucleic acid-binding Zn ribbon protein